MTAFLTFLWKYLGDIVSTTWKKENVIWRMFFEMLLRLIMYFGVERQFRVRLLLYNVVFSAMSLSYIHLVFINWKAILLSNQILRCNKFNGNSIMWTKRSYTLLSIFYRTGRYKMKWNESGFRSPLCSYRLNWARRTSWGWWDDWDDTALQTQDSKFEPWRS